MRQISKDLIDRLRAFRNAPLKQKDLRVWVRQERAQLDQQFAPGLVLKLCSRDLQSIMSSIAILVPACSKCAKTGEQKIFGSRIEQLAYSNRVDLALESGELVRIKRPQWFQHCSTQLGADAYFECKFCGAIWTLVEPERQDNGMWQRIA